jgi:Chitobiase/beta-hexosaminidase C-terminal domain/Bacterial Ig-like domain (group 3)
MNGNQPFYGARVTVGDFNQDGLIEIAVETSLISGGTTTGWLDEGVMEVLTTGAPYNPAANDWPMIYHDTHNSAASVTANPVTPPVATPVFAPVAGTYTTPQMVTISDTTPAATIHYTTDGTVPTVGSNLYGGPITVSASETIQAIVTASGHSSSPVASAAYIITRSKTTPALTVTPSASSITTIQDITVTVAVNGGKGNPTPTGEVTLTSGGYSAQQIVTAGAALFDLPAGTLPVGSNTLTATYTPDASSANTYTSAANQTDVSVTPPVGAPIPTLTVTPSAATITDQQSETITVSIVGNAGQAIPTGNVTLASGAYGAQQTLASGTANFTIAAGTLGSGATTLTATYSGDGTYASSHGSTLVTVSVVAIAAPAPAPVAPGISASATATLSAGSAYSGTMNLACTLTGSPTGAQSLPTCSLNPISLTIKAWGSETSTLSVKTTGASTAGNASPSRPMMSRLGGEAILAGLLMLGFPRRRRRWMSALVLVMVVLAADAIGCGSGGGTTSLSAPTPSTPATTAGTYTFTVTGTDATDLKITTSTIVTITVQ